MLRTDPSPIAEGGTLQIRRTARRMALAAGQGRLAQFSAHNRDLEKPSEQ
jgi:hypothetical protein